MEALETIRARAGAAPVTVALVLGSGLGHLTGAVDGVAIDYADLPGFPHAGVSGHQPKLVVGQLEGVPVAVLGGRAHYYERGDAAVMRRPLEVLRALGVERLILTNAAGSFRADIPPGELMLIADHINFSGTNPLIGETSDARFVGLTSAYDAKLRAAALAAADAEGITLHEGVYMWFSGPSFETPAEIRAARTLGADAVGMSTVPEVILARFLQLRVVAFSAITNYAAGMTGAELSHTETKEVAPQGGAKLAQILKRMLAKWPA
jgi:purine-nucleoside phosphorylase